MPLASNEPPPTLFQYTRWEGLEGAVASQEIWATSFVALNDRMELTYAQALLGRIATGLRESGDHGVQEQVKLAQEWSENLNTHAEDLCVASFTELGDTLSQWRGYGDGGAGFALGYASNRLTLATVETGQACSILLKPVVYDPAVQVGLLLEALEVGRDAAFFCDLAATFKEPRWYEEREWRLVVKGGKRHARRVGTRVAEYAKLKFQPLPLMKVVLGPKWAGDVSTEKAVQRASGVGSGLVRSAVTLR